MNDYDIVITSKRKWFDFNYRELWRYRDLIFLFVRRTFVSQYKQTILGPAWAIIQPLLTTLIFTVVFGQLAGLSTDGVPPFLFYMCGNIAWGYFAGVLTNTSGTFVSNADIMGKVYFPRLVIPIAITLTQMISFVIQLMLFIVLWLIFLFISSFSFSPSWGLFFFPLLIIQMSLLGLGFGVIVSSLTTKYRDLSMLVSFGVQLWMYGTPIAYSLSIVPEEWMAVYMLNPMTSVVLLFREAFLGTGQIGLLFYLLSWVITIFVVFIGVVLFNHVEKTFMDTV